MASGQFARILELLEPRTLLSISTFDAGVVSVYGTAGNDTITVGLHAGNSSLLDVTLNGVTDTYSLTAVTQVDAFGGAGNDLIQATSANGTLTLPLLFAGNAGADTLIGDNGPDTLEGGAAPTSWKPTAQTISSTAAAAATRSSAPMPPIPSSAVWAPTPSPAPVPTTPSPPPAASMSSTRPANCSRITQCRPPAYPPPPTSARSSATARPRFAPPTGFPL